ncbi:MAG: putative HtrA2 peptidase [Candidatus Saccharibacteria bacterium]|nr:putative HtrA2 peptidase [Candidatus Saccharibacteria bacterium]
MEQNDQKNDPQHYTLRLKKPNIDRLKNYRRAPSRRAQLASSLIVLCLLFGLIGGWFGAAVYEHNKKNDPSAASRQQIVTSESQLFASIAKNVGQSVVSVDVQSQTTAQNFFGVFQPLTQQSAGTGFIISDSGIIVTNRHVVPAGTSSVTVTLADGTRLTGVQVIGRTADTSSLDVAFLKITDKKGKKLTPVKIGDSSKMQVGDRVLAIGNALGQFQNTVTSGIISGYGRDVQAGSQGGSSIESLTDLFQTDAAINEGNSGGPLVNINGEVVGLNTAVASGAQNIGFSIPVNDITGLINSVLANGKLQLPYLGVRYVSLTADIAYQYNLNVDKGAYVVPSTDGSTSVTPGSPAEKAGIAEGDIITKVNNIAIDNKTSLTSALTRFKVGDTVTLTIIRDGKTITARTVLEATPAS